MDEQLTSILRDARRSFEGEGFIILGVFGSRARGDHRANSDLDLLYRLEERFYRRYPGWEAAARLDDIRKDLQARTGLSVDMANGETLHDVGRKYILPETIYVA